MRKTSSGTPVSAKAPTPASAKPPPAKAAAPAPAPAPAKAAKAPPQPLPDDTRAVRRYPATPLTWQALLRILGDDAGMRAYEAFASAGLAAFEDLGTTGPCCYAERTGDKSPSLRAVFAEVPWGDLVLVRRAGFAKLSAQVITEHVIPEAKLDEAQSKKLKRRLGDDYAQVRPRPRIFADAFSACLDALAHCISPRPLSWLCLGPLLRRRSPPSLRLARPHGVVDRPERL